MPNKRTGYAFMYIRRFGYALGISTSLQGVRLLGVGMIFNILTIGTLVETDILYED